MQARPPRRFERLTNPLAGSRVVRTINPDGTRGEPWTAMDDDGRYWSGRGWLGGVNWTQLLQWGPLEEVEARTDEPQ